MELKVFTNMIAHSTSLQQFYCISAIKKVTEFANKASEDPNEVLMAEMNRECDKSYFNISLQCIYIVKLRFSLASLISDSSVSHIYSKNSLIWAAWDQAVPITWRIPVTKKRICVLWIV